MKGATDLTEKNALRGNTCGLCLGEAENSTFWKPGCIFKKTLPEKIAIFKWTIFSLWALKEQTSRHRRVQREHLPRDGRTRANMLQRIFTSLQ